MYRVVMFKTKVAPLCLAAVLLLSGCQSTSTDSAGSAPMMADEMAAPEPAVALESGEVSIAAQDPRDASGVVDLAQVIQTGNATVVTKSPDEAATSFIESTEALGGRVESTWKSTWDRQLSSSVTVRVPADKFADALALLPELGQVETQNTDSQDVGLQVSDLEGRKGALEASIKRLTELMEEATTTEALVQAESELTARQTELDGLNSQLDYLKDQVSMSTLSVSFQTEAFDDGSAPGAWEVFLGSLRTMGFALLVALPWILVVGVVATGAWLLIRNRRTRPAATNAEADGETKDEQAVS